MMSLIAVPARGFHDVFHARSKGLGPAAVHVKARVPPPPAARRPAALQLTYSIRLKWKAKWHVIAFSKTMQGFPWEVSSALLKW